MAEETQDDDLTCSESVQYAEEILRNIKVKSQHMLELENTRWSTLATVYVAWYRDVESCIKFMLFHFDVFISTTYTARGQHQHHEDVLRSLKEPDNPFFDVLGAEEVHDRLRIAKENRNRIKSGYYVDASVEWDGLDNEFNIIDKALGLALWGFKLGRKRIIEYEATAAVRMAEIREEALDEGQGEISIREAACEKLKATMESQDTALKEEKALLDMTASRLRKAEDEVNRSRAELHEETRSHKESVKIQKAEQLRSKASLAEESKLLKTKTRLDKDIRKLKDRLEHSEESHKAEARGHKKELSEKDQAYIDETARLKEHHAEEVKQLRASIKEQGSMWVATISVLKNELAEARKEVAGARSELAEAHEKHLAEATRQKRNKPTTLHVQQDHQQPRSLAEALVTYKDSMEGKAAHSANPVEHPSTEQICSEHRESSPENHHEVNQCLNVTRQHTTADLKGKESASLGNRSTSLDFKKDCKSIARQHGSSPVMHTLPLVSESSEPCHPSVQGRQNGVDVKPVIVGFGEELEMKSWVQDYGSWTGWL